MIKVLVGAVTYSVKIEIVDGLYRKINIFHNGKDISKKVFKNHVLLDEIFGDLKIQKNHHIVPKFLLNNWLDVNDSIHEIQIDKKNKTTEVVPFDLKTKSSKKKYFEKIYCALHKYTFFFSNSIVIFEGNLVNVIEEFIKGIIDYFDIIENKVDRKIFDVIVNINNEDVNLTQETLNSLTNIVYGKSIVKDFKTLDNVSYNKLVFIQYARVLFLYSSIDQHFVFFQNIFNKFEEMKNENMTPKEILLCYYGCIINDTQKHLETVLGKTYIEEYIRDDLNGFPICEMWKFTCNDKNNKINIIIPLTPKYAIVMSSDTNAFKTLKENLADEKIAIKTTIKHQINMIFNFMNSKKHLKFQKKFRSENDIYSILLPNKLFAEKIKKHLKEDLFNK